MNAKYVLKNHWSYGVVVILCLSVFLFLFHLGSKPFWDYDEAIYAKVVHDTITNNSVLDLQVGENPWFEKPPLYFWLSMVSDSIFHNPEFSYRLIAALSGILSIVLVMLITFEVKRDVLVASIAGLILLTTGPFLEAGREFRLDVPAIAMVLFSVYSFMRGLRDPRWFLGVGVGLAIGFLFKSVIGLLSLPFILLWSSQSKNFRWIKNPHVLLGSVLSLFIVVPWHAYETIRYGTVFWENYFFHHVFQRFFSDVISGSVSAGDYVYFFSVYAAPWSILFSIFLGWLLIRIKDWNKEHMAAVLPFAATGVCIFIVFLVSSTKIFSYLLPVYPFVAISLALGADYYIRLHKGSKQKSILLVTFLFPILFFSFWVAINFGFHRFSFLAANDTITLDEKNAALILVQDNDELEVYTYEYDYYDTIQYYSGIRTIKKMEKGQELNKPFFLIVSKQYMDWHSFPPALSEQLGILYKGQTLILYKFAPQGL